MRLRFVFSTCILALAGCAPNAGAPAVVVAAPAAGVAAPAAVAEPQAPVVLSRGRGRARVCEALTRAGRHSVGAGAVLSMAVSNDGGWCARRLTYEGYPFTGGNVVDAPSHGEARVRHLAHRSLIEYRATPGYTGEDNFSVTLTPGNSMYLVSVTVQP